MLLAELSYFSRQLCTKEIMVELMEKLEKEIPVGVFCTDKNRVVKITRSRDGPTNYKTHYDLSWFRPLLRGNSLTSSGLILKMNSGYNGVSKEHEKFMK